ncbi:MAG TPA: tetratricopeptide repeat protein [Roseiflexaceae bacterium]|nr:tetratricopeptide repeat protein [Roseiflexaceae bacterium]
MQIRFWGVRGSIPAPIRPDAIEEKIVRAIQTLPPEVDRSDEAAVRAYVQSLPVLQRGTAGGNTTCVEIRTSDALILIDAGSGIRDLGQELMQGPCGRGEGEIHILFSHPHWDHVQGFPFFTPAFIPGNRIFFYSVHDMRTALIDQQRSLFFPVPVSYMRATMEFIAIQPDDLLTIGDTQVTLRKNAHPGDSYSFRFEDRHSVFVFASDAEYKNLDRAALQPAIDFFHKADALVFDAQYTLREAWQKVDWGHSSALIGVDMARLAGVRRLLLFHHDPIYSDEQLLDIQANALAYQAQDTSRPTCEIIIAHEGLELDLTPPGTVDLQLLDGETAVLSPISVFDEQGVDALDTRLSALAVEGGGGTMIIDLSQVETLTTTTLHSLVALGRARQGTRLLLASPSPGIERVIRFAGYSDVFAVYPSVEAALAAMNLRDALDLPGAVLGGRYRIEERLSTSAVGTVLSATDITNDEDLAILVLSPTFSNETIALLLRMAPQLTALEHPAIGPMRSIEQDSGCTFIVSLPLRRPTLQEVMTQHPGPLDPIRAFEIASDLAQALEYLHSCGVVHANLAPQTIFLGDGATRLANVGLGRLEGTRRLLDVPPSVLRPAYVTPEQVDGQEIDARTDLYALGSILFQIFTGRPPFEGDDQALIAAHAQQPPPLPRSLNPAISLGLEHLILKLLAKNPNDRYAGARQVLEVLGSLAVGGNEVVRQQGAMVRRAAQLSRLRDAWEAVQAGHGQLAFIGGELGVGKTRLIRELAGTIDDGMVLIGHCRENHGSPIYQPFVEILRAYVANVPQDLYDDSVLPLLSSIAELVPEVRRLALPLPDLPLLSPRHEQLRLINSIVRFIGHAARRQPWLLVLDDLQWADEATLELLISLGRQLPELPLLVIGIYRDTEIDANHRLRQTLGELDRHPGYTWIALERLDEAGVATMLAQLWGGNVPSLLVEQIFRHTDGNPLYVESIARSFSDDGVIVLGEGGVVLQSSGEIRMAPSVREAVWRRIRRLNPDTQTLLRQAAILGLVFSFEQLHAMSGMSDWEVLEHLDVALERRLLQEVPNEPMLRFSHSEIHYVLYADLGVMRRRLLHRQAAEAIELLAGGRADEHAHELAHHYYEAGEWEKAFTFSMAAGRQDALIYANQRALHWYSRAIDAFAQLDADAITRISPEQLWAYDHIGDLLQVLGRWAEAHEMFDRGMTLAAQLDNRELQARLQHQKGWLLHDQGEFAAAAEWQQRSLALYTELGDEAGVARSLNLLGTLQAETGDGIAAGETFRRSLAIRRTIGDRHGVAATLNNLGMIAIDQGDFAAAREPLEESLTITRTDGYRRLEIVALNNLGYLKIFLGEYDEAQTLLESSLNLARSIGDLADTAIALHNLGKVLQGKGDLAAARKRYIESFWIYRELGDRRNIAYLLEDLSTLLVRFADHRRALLLLGAAMAQREAIRSPIPPGARSLLEAELAVARAALPAADVAAAITAGRATSAEAAVAAVLEFAPM